MTRAIVLDRGGTPIHAWLDGPAGAPIVAFTHGATCDSRMWDAQRDLLVSRYRVLTWDVAGHGRSRPLPADFSIRGAAHDLIAILDAVDAGPVILVGHSMGGSIVQEVAFLQPDRVSAMVIAGSACTTLALSLSDSAIIATTIGTLGWWPDAVLRLAVAYQASIRPAVQWYMLEAGQALSHAGIIEVFAATVRCLHPEPDYRIAVPLLLVRGVYDNVGNTRVTMPVWAAREPRAAFVELPAAGHQVNQDNPAAFNALLSRFLAMQGEVAA